MQIEETTATAGELSEEAAPDEVVELTESEATPSEPGSADTSPDSPSATESVAPELPPSEVDPSGAPAAAAPAEVKPPAEPAPIAPSKPTGTPWSFRVDGTAVDVPGAVVTDDGEIRGLTVESFRNVLQQRYIGDRGAWQKERARLRSEIEARSADNNPEVIRAKQFSDELLRIIDLDVDERDQALDALKRNIPVYQERARAEAAERRAKSYETRHEAEDRDAVLRLTVPALQEGLSNYITSALQHEQLAGLGLDAKELEKDLINVLGTRALFDIGSEAARREPHFNTAGGPTRLQTKQIDAYLLRVAGTARRERDAANVRITAAEQQAKDARAAAEAAKRNAAALNPNPSAPPVVPAGGAPTGGESNRPWRDPSKPADERKKLYAEHMARQGVPL